jgi:3,4-dihydroxy 2-butanone 4-phosphate synthase/GTP cyclohydrolase II
VTTAHGRRPAVAAGRGRPWATVPEAVAALAAGRFVIVVDGGEDRSTGDVLFAASHVTADRVNFLIRETRGVLYLGLTDERCAELELTQMVSGHEPDSWQSAFTVSIEARRGVTTGISAADRARTIAVAIAPESTAADIRRPGHIFPLRAARTGTLARQGRTEAYVDLPRLAGLYPAGVAASVINEDGTLARLPELLEFGRRHDIGVVTVADVLAHRLVTDNLLSSGSQTTFWSGDVLATSHRYRDVLHGREYVAVTYPRPPRQDGAAPLLALAAPCLEGLVLGSVTCDCRMRLDEDLRSLGAHGGVLLWCRDERVCPRTLALPEDRYERAVLAAVVSAIGLRQVRLLPSAQGLGEDLSAGGIQLLAAPSGGAQPSSSAHVAPSQKV